MSGIAQPFVFTRKFSQDLANVNNKLSVANDEVIMHLREKGEVGADQRLKRKTHD